MAEYCSGALGLRQSVLGLEQSAIARYAELQVSDKAGCFVSVRQSVNPTTTAVARGFVLGSNEENLWERLPVAKNDMFL